MTNAEKINFNINRDVWVRLTDHGRLIHRKSFPAWSSGVYSPPVEDANGWSKWQLWELMYEFGHSICSTSPVPFETEILIELPQKAKTPKERGLELIKRIQGSEEFWNLDELDLLTELIQSIPGPNDLVKNEEKNEQVN